MPKSPRINTSKAKSPNKAKSPPKKAKASPNKAKSSRRPSVVFISHDTRDAELAEAFSVLLTDVGYGRLESFRSSDNRGSEGIAYGDDWYKTIVKRIKGASQVVCLLTERSINRPWILYEAGIAKGKSTKFPVFVVAIGVAVEDASTGPFAQFQNCDDSEDKLIKLVMQLVQPSGLTPSSNVVRAPVKAFIEASRRIKPLPAEDGTPAVLQKLKDTWESYRERNRNDPHRDRFKLYSFCGITDFQESDEASPETDLEDVYYLWADAGAGSSISARVLRSGGKRTQIRFDNHEDGHPSNVAFRIRGRNLLYKEDGFRSLKFSVRIPPDIAEGDLKRMQLGIRIVDALTTHWIYSYLEGYKALYVDYTGTEEWQGCSIDLSSAKWKVFETDGNALYHDDKPDLTSILAVIVEVGRRNAQRPGSGKGIVEVKDFAVE